MRTRITPRLIALALLACCLTQPAAAKTSTAAPQHATERRLVGIWQDDHDPDNIIQFYPDHAMRIYLPRSEGGGAHWIDGTWTLAPGGKLTMRMTVPGAGSTPKVKELTIVFTRKGFVVKEGGREVGRQHRISERTLKTHLW